MIFIHPVNPVIPSEIIFLFISQLFVEISTHFNGVYYRCVLSLSVFCCFPRLLSTDIVSRDEFYETYIIVLCNRYFVFFA